MSNQITFVVSGSPVSFTPTAPGQNTYPLPAYDAQNSDLVVTSTCATNVYANWPGGGFTIKPGTTIMLTANAATLAATTNPNVFSMGASGSTATSLSASTDMTGGTITIQRGMATARPVF